MPDGQYAFRRAVVLNRILKLGLVAAAVPWLTASAIAQEPKSSGTRDPNERVCEKIKAVGSRLATKKYCATRAEWEDKKRQDREATDRMQRVPCLPGAMGC